MTCHLFQSQTGSQALSDLITRLRNGVMPYRFNPKREARPSQTSLWEGEPLPRCWFQSQTGSQALSDDINHFSLRSSNVVSIPNGKPGPLRLADPDAILQVIRDVSIPNGKPGPLRRQPCK